MVELVLVVLIVSTLIFFGVPRFRNTGFFQGQDKDVNRLIHLVQELKQRSVKDQLDYFLHLSPDSKMAWITDSAMDDQAREQALENPIELLNTWQLEQIEYPAALQGDHTPYIIKFNKLGYSDMAIIHLAHQTMDRDDRLVSLRIEPFLMEVQSIEGRVSFNDCR